MIYFPATCNILTPGHIQCFEYLSKRGPSIVGLLTAKALKGYKRELVPYKDREYIVKAILKGLKNIKVVPQGSLDPASNLIKYKCTAVASGDGFEAKEFNTIERLGLRIINIKLPGERKKRYSSTKICETIQKA
jgi:hypothetical protein